MNCTRVITVVDEQPPNWMDEKLLSLSTAKDVESESNDLFWVRASSHLVFFLGFGVV